MVGLLVSVSGVALPFSTVAVPGVTLDERPAIVALLPVRRRIPVDAESKLTEGELPRAFGTLV